MEKIRLCVLVMAMISGGTSFVMAQAPGTGEAAKKNGPTKSAEQGPTREIYGKIQSIKGTMFTLQTRSGALIQVDAKPAVTAQRSVNLLVGHAIAVKGTVDKAGVLHAELVQKAKDSPAIWPADR
jgi:hypothetical protein